MKQDFLDGLNRVAEALVLFDSVDLGPLGEAYNELSSLGTAAHENGDDDIAKALNGAADLLENIIMDESGEHYGDLDIISRNISGIVDLIHEHNSRDSSGKKSLSSSDKAKPEKAVSEVVKTKIDTGIDDSELTDIPLEVEETFDLTSEFAEAIRNEPDIAQDFALEAKDHLDEGTTALLQLEKFPDDPDAINQVFRCFHSIKGVAGFLSLKSVQNLAHHAESILDRVRSGGAEFNKQISNLIFEASDTMGELMDGLCSMLAGSDGITPKHDIADLDRRLLEVFPESDESSPPPAASGPSLKIDKTSSTESIPKTKRAGKSVSAVKKEIVKVDAARLNRLIDIIGELVIAETIVIEADETRANLNPGYLRKINQLDKITRELQSMGMSMRMVAVNSTFLHMARIVRDLGDKQNKKIEFITKGEETEIDKNIVDKLGDPLVHMVRNAVDHGIEKTPEERVRAGKPAVATVELRAFHRGGNICIEIEDDGKGIDPDVIFAKAVEKGIISPDASLSKSEIVNLIFAPGFSTAEQITDVSGRGVGMDVVKRNIAELNGAVDVSSELGKGSIVSIRLPLTLAIIDGMVVRVGEERLIVPTLSITRAVNISSEQVHKVNGREFVLHQQRSIPLYRLDRFFDIDSTSGQDNSLMLILEDDAGSVSGIMVDELVGKQQIVIKSLGEAFRNVDGYSGCAILSDGCVGLIIDVNSVIRKYEHGVE